ncbi:MAG: hypothetical protein U0457_09905 [Candidatus Sericytochromatia bacterium]
MNEKNNEIKSSLLDELNDIDSLLNSAISKAKKLEKTPMLTNYNSQVDVQAEQIEEDKVSRPKNWDSMKSSALDASISTFEEQEEKVKDTTKVRTVGKKVTKKLDDNWDDDPF